MSTSRVPVPLLAAALISTAAVVPSARAAEIDSVWAPAADGNWSVPENWDPFGVPSNDGEDFFNVRIDDDPGFVVVGFNLPAAAINALTIDGGDRLRIQNARNLTVVGGPIRNSGVIELFSNNDFLTRLRIDGTVTLEGTGGVEGVGNAANTITTTLEGSRLINMTNPITGVMQIGDDVLSFTTHALVESNVDGRFIILDPPPAGDVTNAFMIRASGGGILQLRDGQYENTSGTFAALDGSQVRLLDGVTINGGLLETEPAGEILVQGQVRIVDMTTAGQVTVQNSRRLTVNGPLANTGDIDVQASNVFPGRLILDGPVALTGGGTISLTGANVASSVIEAVTEGDRLTNVDNTIAGRGLIGLDVMSLTNQSLVEANRVALTITLDPPASGDVTNQGTMRATAGATLRLEDGFYDNGGGLIEAEDASTIDLRTGATVSGGTLRTVDGGAVVIAANPARFVGVAHEASTSIPNNRQLIVEGDFSNTGTVALSSIDVFATVLSIDGDLMLTGGGTVSMTSDIANTNTCRIDALTPGDRLTIADGTIEGNGNLGADVMSTTNHGRIDANHPSLSMTIDPPAAGDFTNLGLLVASGPADLRIDAGPMDNAGDVSIAPGARLLRLAGDYTQTDGATTVEGELQVNAGVVDLLGGTLAGTGLVDADVRVGVAIIAPGLSPGRLDVDGAYLPSFDGTLVIELGGLIAESEHDVLAVSGSAELDGTLCLTLVDDFVPAIGDSFEILTAATVSGLFPCVKVPALPDGGFVVTYETDRVVATVSADAPHPADLNGNGFVEFGDLLIVLSAWGACPNVCCIGDIDGNGVVDFDDLLLVLSAWTPTG